MGKVSDVLYSALASDPNAASNLSDTARQVLAWRRRSTISTVPGPPPQPTAEDLRSRAAAGHLGDLVAYLNKYPVPAAELRVLLEGDNRMSVLQAIVLNEGATEEILAIAFPRLDVAALLGYPATILNSVALRVPEPMRANLVRRLITEADVDSMHPSEHHTVARLVAKTPSAHAFVLSYCGRGRRWPLESPVSSAAISPSVPREALVEFVDRSVQEYFAALPRLVRKGFFLSSLAPEPSFATFTDGYITKNAAHALERIAAADKILHRGSYYYQEVIRLALVFHQIAVSENPGLAELFLAEYPVAREFVMRQARELIATRLLTDPRAIQAYAETEPVDHLYNTASQSTDPRLLSSVARMLADHLPASGLKQERNRHSVGLALITNLSAPDSDVSDPIGWNCLGDVVLADVLASGFPEGVTLESQVRRLCYLAPFIGRCGFGKSFCDLIHRTPELEYIARTASSGAFPSADAFILIERIPYALTECLPYRQISALRGRLRRPLESPAREWFYADFGKVFEYLVAAFGSSDAKWETFESLVENFEGTWGDLVVVVEELS